MNVFHKLIKFFTDKRFRFNILASRGFYNHWPDEKYLKHKFKLALGYELNLENPKTFCEKLQWLKLYDRKPIYTTMVDKYEVKKYIAAKIGEQYVIPTLGVWNSPEEIDFDKLPNQFVLKCNHNSGRGMCICKDKSKLNIKKVKKELSRGLKQDYYLTGREWPYKNVPRKIIAEKYLQDENADCLTDYKFFCFNGTPRFMYISQDLAKIPHTDFFDMNKNRLELRMKDPNSPTIPNLPIQFEEMKKLATILSHGLPFIRVDFYICNGLIFLGELTFFHNAGFVYLRPLRWDKALGEWLILPDKGKHV